MGYDVAHLNEDESKKIKMIEEEMNVILIAYDQTKNDQVEPSINN